MAEHAGNVKVERELREFWVSHDGDVFLAVGYRTTPDGDMWFIPRIDYTCTYFADGTGMYLFDTELVALEQTLLELKPSYHRLGEQISKLKERKLALDVQS